MARRESTYNKYKRGYRRVLRQNLRLHSQVAQLSNARAEQAASNTSAETSYRSLMSDYQSLSADGSCAMSKACSAASKATVSAKSVAAEALSEAQLDKEAKSLAVSAYSHSAHSAVRSMSTSCSEYMSMASRSANVSGQKFEHNRMQAIMTRRLRRQAQIDGNRISDALMYLTNLAPDQPTYDVFRTACECTVKYLNSNIRANDDQKFAAEMNTEAFQKAWALYENFVRESIAGHESRIATHFALSLPASSLHTWVRFLNRLADGLKYEASRHKKEHRSN